MEKDVTDIKTDKSSVKNTEKQKSKLKPVKSNRAAEDFKKRYFEYYDDVKISDRQDW